MEGRDSTPQAPVYEAVLCEPEGYDTYDNIPDPHGCSGIQVGELDPPLPRQPFSSIQCHQPVLTTEMLPRLLNISQTSPKLWLSNNYG
jgi:hypothetical protein